MSKIKRLAGDTALYGLGNMVPRLLNFFLFPIHTKFFSPEAYGHVTLLMSVVAVFNIIFSFGMETAYFRYANKPDANETKIFNIAQTAVMTISSSLSIVFILFASTFADLLHVPGHSDYIIWLTLVMFIDNAVSIPFARLRWQKKPITFAIYRITNVVVLTGLNLYFLYEAFDPAIGIAYIFLSNLAANAVYIVFFFGTFAAWKPTIDRDVFPTMVKYAYPVMLTGLAGMMNEFFSRLTLESWLPKNFYPGRTSAFALGVFGGCYKLSVFMQLAVQAFRLAGEPFFFSNAADKNSPQLFARVNHYFVIVSCFILLAISINLDILKHLMRNPDYWEGLSIVPPLTLGYLFLGVYYNVSVWFKLTDKTYYGTIITIGGALLTLLLNYILIPIAGYEGSSWATAAVYGAMLIACYGLGQRYYPIPYRVVADATYIFVTYLIVIFVNRLTFDSLWISAAVHALILVLFLGVVYLLERPNATSVEV